MFNVSITGKSTQSFDSIADAVGHAASSVYLSGQGRGDCIEALAKGDKFEYTYGYKAVCIAPDTQEQIYPLVEQIYRLCETYDINMLAHFEIDGVQCGTLLSNYPHHRVACMILGIGE